MSLATLPEALTFLACPGCGNEWTDDSFDTSDGRCPACHGCLTCDVCGELIVGVYETFGPGSACPACYEAASDRLRDWIERLIDIGYVAEATAAVRTTLLDRSPVLREAVGIEGS